MKLAGRDPGWVDLNIILPVGISFYTFQTLSYTFDVYARRLPASRSPLDFALFVSFFPQLVAGPIVRAATFLAQLERPTNLRIDRVAFFLILRGLAKKVLFADNIAVFPDAIFADPSGWSSTVIVLATVAFSVQIYCDFSGYSDMAIGIGRVLGFDLPQNFARPYFARSPRQFWSRWHISLSTWLRDYVYIPMGGSRSGEWNTRRNLMLTMLLGGLWHGSSWNFVLWGALHGLALVVHRAYLDLKSRSSFLETLAAGRLYRFGAFFLMQSWVLLTWVTFRIADTRQMLYAVKKVVFFDFDFQFANIGLGSVSFFSTLTLLFLFGALHLYSNFRTGLDAALARTSTPTACTFCVAIGLLLFLLWPNEDQPFIYFQF